MIGFFITIKQKKCLKVDKIDNFQTDTTYDMILGLGTRCHEMSHQWFGDLVTNDWWNEIMIHESIARYFEVYCMGGTYPTQFGYMVGVSNCYN